MNKKELDYDSYSRELLKIPIKKYVMDEKLSWEERYKKLEEHHTIETQFLLGFATGQESKIKDLEEKVENLEYEVQYLEEELAEARSS